MANGGADIIDLHPEGDPARDNADWQATVRALRMGVQKRQRGALEQDNGLIRKLEQEMGPLASTLSVRQARVRAGLAGPTDTIGMTERMDLLRARLADLRDITRKVRSAMVDGDDGPTPQQAEKGPADTFQDIKEGLREAAREIRSGWLVRTPGGLHVKAADLEDLGGGPGDFGPVATVLMQRYTDWTGEMARIGSKIWPVSDVICSGRTLAESAKLRRVDPAIVRSMLDTGLIAYVVLWPDRLDKHKA